VFCDGYLSPAGEGLGGPWVSQVRPGQVLASLAPRIRTHRRSARNGQALHWPWSNPFSGGSGGCPAHDTMPAFGAALAGYYPAGARRQLED